MFTTLHRVSHLFLQGRYFSVLILQMGNWGPKKVGGAGIQTQIHKESDMTEQLALLQMGDGDAIHGR